MYRFDCEKSIYHRLQELEFRVNVLSFAIILDTIAIAYLLVGAF